jgi:TonB family protein
LEVGSKGEETVVSFQLNRSGRIERESVKIEQSSGNSFYDQAALRAIYEADPLPPWPEGLHTDSLRIYFRFELSNKT